MTVVLLTWIVFGLME